MHHWHAQAIVAFQNLREKNPADGDAAKMLARMFHRNDQAEQGIQCVVP
jgi:hypothetical protein